METVAVIDAVDSDIITCVFDLVAGFGELELFAGVAKSSRAPFEDLHVTGS